MIKDRSVTPNKIPWPPVLLAMTISTGIVLQMQFPIDWNIMRPIRMIISAFGSLVIISALFIDYLCYKQMKHADTPIMPTSGARTLLTTGIFSFSRNPIYVGNVLIIFGAGLAFNNFWLMGLAPVLGIAIHFLAIKREEEHLALKFGEEWEAYRKKTRRWI